MCIYTICSLFLQRKAKTAALQKSVAQDFLFFISFLFFLAKHDLPQESLWLHNFCSNDDMKF